MDGADRSGSVRTSERRTGSRMSNVMKKKRASVDTACLWCQFWGNEAFTKLVLDRGEHAHVSRADRSHKPIL